MPKPRTRKAAAPKQPAAPPKATKTVFMTRTRTIYASMEKRFSARVDGNGRITRAAHEIPFTLEEMRAAILRLLGGDYGGVSSCPHCRRPLTAADFQLDHAIPVTREREFPDVLRAVQGGVLGMGNLDLCCESCNRAKGKLTDTEFRSLLAWLQTVPESARKDVLGRLKVAGGFTRMRFIDQQKRKKQESDHGFVPALDEEKRAGRRRAQGVGAGRA